MRHDWLLVETLTPQFSVVAQGRQLRKFVAIETFLRRNPHMQQVTEAVADTAATAIGSIRETANADRLIRTAPVIMTDGRVHGVQVWTGPNNARQPKRPAIGAVVWDLTAGVAIDTPQAVLMSGGMIPSIEQPVDRTVAEHLMIGDANHDESQALAFAVNCKPGQTFCSTWNVKTRNGETVCVSFASHAALEAGSDGTDHLIARALNWRTPCDPLVESNTNLAHRILRGMAQEGVHRALIDLKNWRLLKWLDPPNPHVDWRGEDRSRTLIHPDDDSRVQSMLAEFVRGPVSALLRLRARAGGWVLVHVTMCRVELNDGVYAGLISTRLPTPAELTSKHHSPTRVVSGNTSDDGMLTDNDFVT